ncbi:MAG: cation-translocating P-type ATPase [Chitinophagaceae bacterium]|jgi:Ca2+-transporting ATPase|nr:cation-translocating P-type ATPase [Chitinophagaceae bacterium]
MNWHQQETEKIYEITESSSKGLSKDNAEKKLKEVGENVLAEKKKQPAWMLFLHQFKDFMILVLIAAAIISGLVGELTDTIIILIIVLLNAIVGFVQEYRAEKAMEALKQLATPNANVIRDGRQVNISSTKLVPGDLILLEAGVLIPADIRLTEVHSLRIEESSLTGESVAVDKVSTIIEEGDIPLGDRLNMAYKGTSVTNGRGYGIVIGTGMNTEIGKIAGMLQEDRTSSPLQLRMADFSKKISYLILVICVVLFGVGILRGEEPMQMLLVAISLAVAAIPEALPALITIALAKGANRLVRKNALMRKLPAVETLGSVTFICTDKTGTLTQNKMKVVDVFPAENLPEIDNEISFFLLAMSLNHDAVFTGDGEWKGDPTEIALVEYTEDQFGKKAGLEKIIEKYPREAELPFDSDRKSMTTIHKMGDKYIAIVKGATENIADILTPDHNHENIREQNLKLASNGIRVLAYGYRFLDKIPEPFTYEAVEKDLKFVGLVGMIDPPREEARQAIKECQTAGIHSVMITGDHKETASAIAKDLGILSTNDLVVTGNELSKMSEEVLDEKVENIRVYARVSPEQKLNIVKSLQRKHHFVAMTGDGVNDAPSLKRANIGIAMGITGTDVSKEASDMILLDDNFATIVKAVKEGRRIYDNIRKFVKYIMTCNGAEIWTIFMAPFLGLPIPLLPIHILWINLVTDGLPGLTLSSEKAEKDIMQRPPRKTAESLFAGGITFHIIWVGILMAVITLGTQAWSIQNANTHWQTMVFTVLSLSQLGHVFAIRSDHEFVYKTGIFSNMPLLISIIITFILQLGVIYLPFANTLFKTQPLTLNELLICIGLSAIVFHAVEAEKWVKQIRRKKTSLG